MSITNGKPKWDLSILAVAFLLFFCVPIAKAKSQKACSPSEISRPEAERLLGSIPPALTAKRSGGKLTFVNWEPGADFRLRQFYFFQLLSTSTSDTPLDNGMIGYFGVNKATGEVVELNSDKPHVEGTELQRLQKSLRTKHCVGDDLIRTNANLSLER